MAAAAAASLVTALQANDLAGVRGIVRQTPAALNAKGSGGRTPVHIAVALRRCDALEAMLACGAADLSLTNEEPDHQTAADLAEELGHAMISRLLKAHGAQPTGKKAYTPAGAAQNQTVSIAGQTITLTPEQQAASASNRKLIGVVLVMIFIFQLDWKLTCGAAFIYYKMSGGDAAPGGFDHIKAGPAATPPPPAVALPAAASSAGGDGGGGAGKSAGLLKKEYKEAKLASEKESSNDALKQEYKRAKKVYKAASD